MVNLTAANSAVERIIDPYSNSAAVTSRDRFTDFSITNSRKPYNLLTENIFSLYYGLGLRPHTRTFEFVVTKFKQLEETGVLNYLISSSIKKEIEADDEGPKILTLEDLDIGFVIWLTALGVSSLAFFTEFLMHKIRFCLRKTKVVQV